MPARPQPHRRHRSRFHGRSRGRNRAKDGRRYPRTDIRRRRHYTGRFQIVQVGRVSQRRLQPRGRGPRGAGRRLRHRRARARLLDRQELVGRAMGR